MPNGLGGAEIGVFPAGAGIGADLHPGDRRQPGPGPSRQQDPAGVDDADPAHEVRESGRHHQRARPDPGDRVAASRRPVSTGRRWRSGSRRTVGRAPSICRSHLTCAMPYQPGTTSRSGAPCCGGSGAPFISSTSSTSSASASASAQAAGVVLLDAALDAVVGAGETDVDRIRAGSRPRPARQPAGYPSTRRCRPPRSATAG